MADLESSWQESVIKLAQTGNLRAIAFWLNRYLVPQGICAQVTHEQPGSLLIRVVCHRPPERERLVRFICHRLCKLNAVGIQEARITAQIIGSPTLLWEKSARIASAQIASSLPVSLVSPAQVPSPAIGQTQPLSPTSVRQVARQSPRQPQRAKGRSSFNLLKRIPSQWMSRLHRTTRLTLHQTAPQWATEGQPVAEISEGSPVAVAQIPDLFLYSKGSSQIFSQRSSHSSGAASISRQDSRPKPNALTLPQPLKRQIRRSLRGFLAFPPHVRILLLAGSIAAAFLVGAAFQALRNSEFSTVLPSSDPASFGSRKFSLGSANTVWTALENVPVIQQSVVNPQDPAVTLLFANSATLGRVSQGNARRLADMVITSLDQLPPAVRAIAAPVPLESGTADDAPPDSVSSDALPPEAPDTRDAEGLEPSAIAKLPFPICLLAVLISST
ncbi:MAG: hypothetical protein HC781_20685 [Leptolyngbyaceae cyanobacterium CSU_1_4]|nr:hypothetical protein [Leptolyngbyaceae cyanobacterium CSU_1_4]